MSSIVEDRLAFRLSGRRNEKGGQYINNFNGDREVGEEMTQSVVGTLVATPRENIKLKLRANFTQIDDGPSNNFKFGTGFANCDPDGNGSITFLCGKPPGVDAVTPVIGFQDAFNPAYFNNFVPGLNYVRDVIGGFSLYSPTGRPVTDSNPINEKMGLAKRVEGATFQASVDLPRDMSFDWISGYDKTRSSIVSDENTLPRDGALAGIIGLGDIFLVERFARNSSHEARVTSGDEQRLRWVAGASLVSGEVVSSCVAGINGFGPAGFTCRPILETETLGAFGGLYFDLTEQLTLSAEMRIQNDEISIPTSGDVTEFDDVGGRITLEYSPNDDVMYFINYSRGFRPGSFNSIFAVLSPTEQASLIANSGAGFNIDPETLDQFEFGIKGDFLDGRLQGSAVAYIGKIKDQQQTTVTNYIDDMGNNQLITVITNVGEVDLHGLELEGAFAASETWTLQATLGWNYTEFTKGTCRACVVNIGQASETDFLGNQTPWTPELTASVVATYSRPVMKGKYDGFVRGEAIFESTKYATEANLLETGDRQVFNLRAGLQADAYRLEAYITNVFDDDTYYYVSRQTDLDTFGVAFNVGLPDKRAYGLRVTLDF